MKNIIIAIILIICTSFHSLEKSYWIGSAYLTSEKSDYVVTKIIEASDLNKAKKIFSLYIKRQTVVQRASIRSRHCEGEGGQCFWVFHINPKEDILK